MKFVLTYIRTLLLEETLEVATQEEAALHAKKRTGELLNSDFETSETECEVEEAGQVPQTLGRIRLIESTSTNNSPVQEERNEKYTEKEKSRHH